jgi:WD40 repeat protein
MRRVGILVAQIGALVLSSLVSAQKYQIPRLQQGTLLVRTYLPDGVVLTTKDKTMALPAILQNAFLSISSDGSIIGAIRCNSPHSPGCEISTYSPENRRVTDHLEVQGFTGGFGETYGISPDGSKMAYLAHDVRTDSSGLHFNLRVLDFRTGKVSVVANPPGEVREISWSPDGRRIAFDMESPGNSSEIRTINIVDVETGKVSKIGMGGAPSWSPSGEWIAYVGYVPTLCENSQPWYSYAGRYYATGDWELRLMSTVGTHSRRLMRLHDGPNLKPLWSPDSQTLLFQKMKPDTATVVVYMVDIATGKATKKFKNVGPITAWVAGK